MAEQRRNDVLERFLRYVRVDSQSDPHVEGRTPTTDRQHDMARVLADDLRELGCADAAVDDHAYVTAHLPATPGLEALPCLGLCAHIDTSYDAPASGVRPHVVRYEGGPLVSGVVDGRTVQTTVAEVPDLERFVGQDIVCSDGSTLLGADDKAGVAEIMALVARLSADPSVPHPRLAVAFVPDEEVGHGADLLDIESFGAEWCYTVDGEALGEFNYECFSAASARVTAHGTMVHPGSAKNVMVNALTLLREYDSLLPAAERPEHTEGREGYFHATEVSGTAGEAALSYILRDFDDDLFEARQRTMRDVAEFLNGRYGAGTVEVRIDEQYRNMGHHFVGREFLIENALAANREAGIEPFVVAVRGGTDGAHLTLRGLPCPNLATGGYNAHSVREFVPVPSLEAMVDVLERLVAKFAVPQGQAS